MFLYFNHSAPKARVRRNLTSNRAVFMASLSAIAVLTGCGGGKPANLSPTNNGNLTISANLPTGMEGSGYTGTVTASGGTSPYNFAITSGQMPQGVNLDRTTGTVSGTPTVTGSFSFGVTVSDAKGASQEKGLQISVGQAAAPPPPRQPARPR